MTDEAVVVGAGRSVWTDLRQLRDRGRPTYFAINDMIVLAPNVHHAVSHHPEKLPHWDALRTHSAHRGPREPDLVTHASAPGPGVARVWPEYRGGGSSALLAVRIALALGHRRVLVAGVPLDDRGYVWSDPEWTVPPGPRGRAEDFARYRKAWTDAADELRGRVFAVSGWLAEWLGPPPPLEEVAA